MELDEMVARDAETQHGVFTVDQVRAHGGSDAALHHRLRTGVWRTFPYRGVYRVAGCPSSWEQELHALVLATGPIAAASHRSAAALLGMPGFSRRGVIEILTTRPIRDRTPGARVHSSRVLPPEHLTVVEGIATTGTARTLLDLAGATHPRRIERVLDNCLARGLVTLTAVRATTEVLASKGRPGIAVMRRLLAERPDGYIAPESGLEARVLDVIREAGLPQPVRQLDVGGSDGWLGRVDLAYPDRKLVIEVDSVLHHSTHVDRRADQIRDRRIRGAGWRVERVTEAEMARPGALADRLKALLDSTAA
jgi:hypothetical protein